ncbi:DUF4234 domain-containing protein [Marinobacterium stanieri]|uniref:DUF4234 domain-containing protein n=1 Tax=Marinobacterium stanieri TaxID=49186 RepID=A0A1N6W9C8_9GAMM|nr:DUF4234 domain-containing protein [Marinobacterium stanieri]SIQ86753.1 protein of unknown function [Marinobacterium stanieri]
MNQIADNPYAAPEAELEVQQAEGDLSVFKYFTTWAVLGLSIITLGIYPIYWLYNRTQKLNTITPTPISQGFVTAALVIMILSTVLSYVLPFLGSTLLVLIGNLISLVSTVLFFVWVFKFRNRLNAVTQSQGQPTWAGPVLTFFFSIFYLNYKINQHIDHDR